MILCQFVIYRVCMLHFSGNVEQLQFFYNLSNNESTYQLLCFNSKNFYLNILLFKNTTW